ncbi:alcohol dehydrogenase catalytic domain-containing protein [Paracoccus onubensis]|uniref:alcohol dehydrogenase catalytic domain-containing protein n=1 Tax=Paracoccus onubensis TaxID=1675788 RepID=UPI002730C9E9|nr:alcohol dehydrogenase catalytic domain-containing protein [Paracoccus onubensis]MDP0926266.1 alcohol dehydrogenase catalytic domain-containing protein [Paracoccus onubensis]
MIPNEKTMQAADFLGEDRIEIVSRPLPEPAEGEVLLRVAANALCGSDLKLWHAGAQHIAGHEIAGWVQQPGHPLNGQLCAVYIPLHCGECAVCLRGDTQSCITVSSLIGWNRDGGYAQYLTVPENCLLPVPGDIDAALAPLLLDTIGTSAHALREASRHLATDAPSVLVTGAGPVGLGVVLAAAALGHAQVDVAEPNPARAAIAREFGANIVPVGSHDRRYDLIVECSGNHAARDLAIHLVLPKGVIVLVGENAAPWSVTEDKVFRRKDFALLRTFYFPRDDFAANVELLRANREKYARLVDDAFPIAELPQKFADFAEGKSIKPILSFIGEQ